MMSTKDDWSTLARPFHVRCYEILRSRDFDAAVSVVTSENRACSTNFLIAQTPDKVVDIEAAPGKMRLLECEGGCLVHTNNFTDPATASASPSHRTLSASFRKAAARAWASLLSQHEKISGRRHPDRFAGPSALPLRHLPPRRRRARAAAEPRHHRHSHCHGCHGQNADAHRGRPLRKTVPDGDAVRTTGETGWINVIAQRVSDFETPALLEAAAIPGLTCRTP